MLHARPQAPFAAMLSMTPQPVLARLVRLLISTMRRRHPRLIAAFGRLDPVAIHIAPTDLPHRFAIECGGGRLDVRLLRASESVPPDATVRGSLQSLIDMLEGRDDGDSLFFSRDIEIAGSSAAVVAVRNTLDREEIRLRDEIASLFGPFERPARGVARRIDAAIGRVGRCVASVHTRLHAGDARMRDFGAENDVLRADMQALKTRLAKLDVRQIRMTAAPKGMQ